MSLTGVIPPVVTPLTASGDFDYESFARNANRMIDAGVHGLFAMGSSGEVAFSTSERRDEVTSAAVEVAAGRVPVVVGVIDMQTTRVIEHAQRAQELGAAGIVATAPFYALGGEAEVERHFRVIADNIDLPLYAYDIPVCVHTKLGVNMLMRLGEEGVLAGIKDSSGDDVSFRILSIKNRDAGSPLALLTGHEVVVDGAYMSGADGSVPGLANIDPHGYVRQWDAYQRGDWDAVREEQDRLVRLMMITQVVEGVAGFGAGVGAFKTALNLMGIFETNNMPEPVTSLTGSNVEAIAEVLAEVGLLD
ncbi:dihydrodipicolinate synthase family protein [Schaalia sp. JY-X159]|uniref:dihydrodipicolinate synthase family protein n=1 Tax=Schaalia sp. JY-X159 TaxID=2758575 RepID=UPI00165DFDED|nr:dihydrodipicolinate synthase family protein [Schaalia sp. JY-X159]